MDRMKGSIGWKVLGTVLVLTPVLVCVAMAVAGEANALSINARSAVVVDMSDGKVLFEQNPDELIPPASLTKILTLYIVFEAIEAGEIRLTDSVPVSAYAASMRGSRMGLRAGRRVPLEELIKGMAVVSGNDACVATAEYLSGTVDEFVRRMNAKARQLGMTNSHFMTPNGLPAKGQVTTAHDIAKLSVAYLMRFPDSLQIHSMQSYTYEKSSHHNANRLLGKCPGVDGLKTGFVCASGYNISATGKRGNVRILAVVMGAPTPYVRLVETGKLMEAGFRTKGLGVDDSNLAQTVGGGPSPSNAIAAKKKHVSTAGAASAGTASQKGKAPAKTGAPKAAGDAAKAKSLKAAGKATPAGVNKTAQKKNDKNTSVQHDATGSGKAVRTAGAQKQGGNGTSATAVSKAPAGGNVTSGAGKASAASDHANAKKKHGPSEKPTSKDRHSQNEQS